MAQEIYHRSEWGNPNEQWGNIYLNADLTNELYKRASEYENSWVTDQLLNGVGTKPSIILTPTAYEDGKLNSVKPKGGENLLTYSEDFSQSNWQKYQISLNSNNTISPDGTQNASEITINSSTPSLGDTSLSLTVGDTYTLSCFVKKGANRWVRLASVSSGSLGAWFDLENNVVGTVNSTFASIENYGNGWYRISNTITAISGTNQAFIGLSDADGGTSSTQVGNTVYVWGFQVERGSKTSTYISTNGTAKANGDFDFTRGSSATRVNEQGLVQDVQILSGELVQNGNFEQIGSELVTNGGFNTDSDWAKGTGWSIANGNASYDGSGTGYQYVLQSITTTSGSIYKINFDVLSSTGTNLNIVDFGSVRLNLTHLNQGNYTFYAEADSTSETLVIYANGTDTFSIDNVSVKEVGQNWEFGTGWTIGDGKVIADGTMTASDTLNQSYNFTDNNKYRFKFTVSDYQSGSVYIREPFNGSSDAVSSNGTFTFDYIVGTANEIRFRSNDGFTGSIDNISVIEITDSTDLPRINYTNFDYENGEVVPYSGEGSLLLEPQSTNLITYSEDFTTGWSNLISGSGINPVVTSNQGISPDGSLNADKVVFDLNGGTSSSDYSLLDYSLSGFSNPHTLDTSIYLKSSDGNNYQVAIYNRGTSVQIITVTNQWQRFSVNGTRSNTTNNFRIGLFGDNSTNTASLLLFAAQAELGSYATSYIPTNGSTVTRLADVCNNAGSSDLINSTEGVLYAEISALADDGTERILSLSDGSTTNRLELKISAGGNLKGRFDSAFSDITLTETEFNPSNFNKIALVWSSGRCALFLNGVKEQENLTFNTFSNNVLFNLSFYSPYLGGSNNFYGNVRCVAVFKEELSDEELQKLTQV